MYYRHILTKWTFLKLFGKLGARIQAFAVR
jgi:hypothetical protein